jgi:hypothetical protein
MALSLAFKDLHDRQTPQTMRLLRFQQLFTGKESVTRGKLLEVVRSHHGEEKKLNDVDQTITGLEIFL